MTEPSLGKASDIPDDSKTLLAQLYKALHENGVSRQLFLTCLESAGFSVDPSTLDRWVVRLDTTGSAISQNKQSGNEPSLHREQRDVTSGMVLHENAIGNIVSLSSFQDFAFKYFDIRLSYSTISRYLDEDGFACRLVKKKGKSFVVDIDALRAELWKWNFVQDHRSRGLKRDKLCSADCTFTSHRSDRRTSFSPRGGPQPMVVDNSSNFTNCIVTNVWADGENRTPSRLYTYNPAFRKDRNPTKIRLQQVAHLDYCLGKYGISEDRIIYIGNQTKEMRKYARECPEIIRLFFSDFEVPTGCTIYTDEGNAFFDKDQSVLLETGFQKHKCYPSKVHQYLSINDNPLHGTSKQQWRNSGVDFSDDVESCILLLHLLDINTVKHSKYWWNRNMIELTEEGVNELIPQGTSKRSHLQRSWLRSYDEFMNENDENNK